MQREGEVWRGGPKGRRQWGSAVSRQGVVQKSGGRVKEGTMPSGLGWCGHRGRAWLSPLGSHGTSPNFLRLHPHSPGSAPPRLDGSSFSASMAPRATCSARDGRQLVLLTPSPRVARPAEGCRVGRPRRRRATTGFRLRATSWGNRDSSLHPHFPPHQSPICLASSASPPPSRAQGRAERSPREGWTVQSAVGPRARYSR